jgi:hypothetical protein
MIFKTNDGDKCSVALPQLQSRYVFFEAYRNYTFSIASVKHPTPSGIHPKIIIVILQRFYLPLQHHSHLPVPR